MSIQETIDAIETAVAQTADVVGSVLTLIDGFVEGVRNAGDDAEELEAILASISEQTDRLAAAVVTVAPASPAADDGPATVEGGEADPAVEAEDPGF